jgi:thioredoxin reductase (NADPH)
LTYDPVSDLTREGEIFNLKTESGKTFQTRAVIAACGTDRRKLNIPGEKELTGKGVSYCVTCDAPFFRDKTVALVGGSDAACSGAVHLGQFAKKIYLIYRKETLRAEPFWVQEWQKLAQEGKGEFINNTNVIEILDKVQGKVSAIKLDKPFKDQGSLSVDGVFIEIGGVPGSDLLKPLGVILDQ